jgi:hypothetical protein
MKVQRPISPATPETSGVDSIGGSNDTNFAAKLEKSRAGGALSTDAAHAPKQAGMVSDIAADLQAGKCTKAQAIDRVVDRLLDKRLGPQAPPEIRTQVATALRNALEEDPRLAAKLAQLD